MVPATSSRGSTQLLGHRLGFWSLKVLGFRGLGGLGFRGSGGLGGLGGLGLRGLGKSKGLRFGMTWKFRIRGFRVCRFWGSF